MTLITDVTSITPAAAEDDGPDRDDASDVFVCKREARDSVPDADPAVTLIVTGWHNVQPGPLSWPFPSMRSALDAVRKMRNAIEWSIVLGKDFANVDEARAKGVVLIEQRS